MSKRERARLDALDLFPVPSKGSSTSTKHPDDDSCWGFCIFFHKELGPPPKWVLIWLVLDREMGGSVGRWVGGSVGR
jgi:hypothetical protein